MKFNLRKLGIISVSALMLLGTGAGISSVNTNVNAKRVARKARKPKAKRNVHRHGVRRSRKRGATKRTRKPRARRHVTRRTGYGASYGAGYKFARDDYSAAIGGSYRDNQKIYFNPGLSSRKFDKGYIKGYIDSTPKSHIISKEYPEAGESIGSLTDEAKTTIRAHNQLAHSSYAEKVGFLNTMSENHKKVSNHMKNSKQYKLGVKVGMYVMNS